MGINLPYPLSQEARILIVDDSETNVASLRRLLIREGYEQCTGFSDPRAAMQEFIANPPHLLLLDWHMEPVSGEDFLLKVRSHVIEADMPPVLIVTADTSIDSKRKALQAGATDFLSKPFDHIEILLRIRNLLNLRMLYLSAQSENMRLENKVLKRTVQLERSLSDLQEAQGQMIQQERLRALGAMAGGVAHDFNNALMVILGFCDLITGEEDDEILRNPARVREVIETINTAAKDGVEIVRRLGEFYRPDFAAKNGKVPVNLNAIIEESARLCEPKWCTQKRAEGIFIDLQLDLGDVPPVAAVTSELREMFMNLIFNAVDAMPQGGCITLRTGIAGNQVYIEVEDTGTGMTAETRARCLEPFYTTKGDRGTGLGLAIIYGIVRRHEGNIHIDSELNKGTKFTVLLPLASTECHTLREEETSTPYPRRLNVLVVDDHALIRQVISGYLGQDGHTTVIAENGCEALERCRTSTFDLVITDRVMPKMSGDQLASAIKETNPHLPVIVLTGFSDEQQPIFTNADLQLAKPVTQNSIRHAMHKAMASVASAASAEPPATAALVVG